MDNGERGVPWGAPDDSRGNGWPGNGFGPPPGGPGGPDQGRGPYQDPNQGPYQGQNQGPNPGPHQGPNPGLPQGRGGSPGAMTSFPLAATGAYAAVRPPAPPPSPAPPGPPPPMTSFPLAATGAYQAARPGNPDLSASGFGPMSQVGPDPALFTGPPGPPPGADSADKRRRALLIGASAIAVAGVAAGAIALGTGGGDGKKQPAAPASTATSAAARSAPGTQPSSPGQPVSGAPSSPAAKPATPPPPAAPVADLLHWRLNDKIGSTTAADGSGKNRVGTVGGAAGFSTAHGGSAEFSGAAKQIKGGWIQTRGPAIDTTKSFTVSMWVDQSGFSTPTKFASAFSQDGPQCSAFSFSYSLDSKTWSFVRANADGANPVMVGAGATAPSPLTTWVKLNGVYDAQAGTIAFYLNGVPQGAPVKTGSAQYAATGPFAIGRSWYGKFPSNPFKGYITDVQVFGRALTADEVKAL